MPFLCSQDVFLTETQHLGTCLVLVIASQRIRCCWRLKGRKAGQKSLLSKQQHKRTRSPLCAMHFESSSATQKGCLCAWKISKYTTQSNDLFIGFKCVLVWGNGRGLLPWALFWYVMPCRPSVDEDAESYCLFGDMQSLGLDREVNGFVTEVQTAVSSLTTTAVPCGGISYPVYR